MKVQKSQIVPGLVMHGELQPVELMAFNDGVFLAKAQPMQAALKRPSKPSRPESRGPSLDDIDAMVRRAQERVAAIAALLGKK